MQAGSLLLAASLVALAGAHGPWLFYAAWLGLGLAMRMTLYDAAFAALARLAGPLAKRPISQITLLGGLAATVFWPIGHLIESMAGWRVATLVFAGCAFATLPLHRAIPNERYAHGPVTGEPSHPPPRAVTRADKILAACLFAFVTTFVTVLNAGMSAHMIGVLAGLGLSGAASVWIATLRGVGQSLARAAEFLFGQRFSPLWLGLLATGVLPFAFAAGLFSGTSTLAAVAFAFLYGAGNGLATIVRGTQPLVLFDHRVYGSLVGSLIMPSFFSLGIGARDLRSGDRALGRRGGPRRIGHHRRFARLRVADPRHAFRARRGSGTD